MLDWEKINARLEKEREIKWLRKIKNIDETGQRINGQTGFTIFSDIESQEIFIIRYMPIKKIVIYRIF